MHKTRLLIATFVFTLYSPLVFGAERQETSERVSRNVVDTVHAAMASLPIVERKALFRVMTPSMKAELWRMQLQKFIAEHPDLSTDQLAVLGAASTLLTARTFELEPSSPEWEDEIGAPLRQLETAARMQFSREMIVVAFGRIGPSDDLSTSNPNNGHRRAATQSVDDCECTRANDWCFLSDCGGGGSICHASADGCGWWWQLPCTSVCG